LLSEITGVPVQPNKAIIGRNAFAHEAGIHQDGMIKNPLTYEIMTPQSVGVPSTRLVLGKHSGRHALGLRCEELGFRLDRHQLDQVYRNFIALADAMKTVEDSHIMELIRQLRLEPSHPCVAAESPHATVINSGIAAGRLHPGLAPGDLFQDDGSRKATPMALGPHENEQQEDYLWGV
jgi:isopropylmalate/homocitrate/citramalate synthase